ncbi:adenylate/guanylate cyclase domain-containing protein [Myxococcaceae bacterium GXIMD 01537]
MRRLDLPASPEHPSTSPREEQALEARYQELEARCRELEERARSLDAINRLAASLLHFETDLDDILWDVANGTVAHLGLEDCVIYLLDDARRELVQRAAYGPKNPQGREILSPLRIPVGQGIVGTVARTGRSELIRDTREDPRYIRDDAMRLSELAVPIFFRDEVIGVLDTEHSRMGFFTQEHLHILTTIASMLAARIGRALLDEQLRQLHQGLEARIAERTRELRDAHRQSERLLLNVLPKSIAERLMRGEPVFAERFDEVTVLFADLVGFTRWAASTSPEAVVGVLGRVFTAFDALSERYGLEKIKTLGDAYMVVAGVPAPRPDHREVMATMALEMLREVARLNGELGTALDVRVGMHSGPVVAGVLGTRKAAYDLWGDTVNMASRLESHGAPGRIQVAESLWRALSDRFDFEPRGEVDIKSIGPTPTWLLLGPRSR